MYTNLKEIAYQIIRDFLNALTHKDVQTLRTKFHITDALLLEINEEILIYFSECVVLSLAPKNLAFSKSNTGRVPFDLYEMNEANTWGVECVLWGDSEESEAVLHIELSGETDNLEFSYKYIGS